MRGSPILAALTFALTSVGVLGGSGALGQTMQDAHNDGNAFGIQQGAAHVSTDDTEATAQNNLPNYNGANAPQTSYMADPASLDAVKASVAATNDGYRLTVDGNVTRPVIAPSEIKATLARGNVVAQDPATYAGGIGSGSAGQCVALPPSTSTGGTFEATCDKGLQFQQGPKSCAITTDVKVANSGPVLYDYFVAPDFRLVPEFSPFLRMSYGNWKVSAAISTGTCKIIGIPVRACVAAVQAGFTGNVLYCNQYQVTHVECSADLTDPSSLYWRMPSTHQFWYAKSGGKTATASQNTSQCAALAKDTSCSAPVETCIDGSPATRTFNGVDVTQSCWVWSRTYTCNSLTPADNCSAKTIPQGCTFAREECLDDPAPSDPAKCQVFQEVYTCPIKGPPATKQYVCGGDVYCINGDCEPIVREQSTEFKDAVVGMHTLSEASKSLNTTDFTLFKGAAQTCSKPVFGLGNCCGGHGFPLIGNCSGADHLLAKQIDKGITHYVGTYCAKSFFVCTTKAQSYCVFGSKLTRILQEQGRPQINKGWGKVKHPDCSGFTVDQFAALDLSRMNFTEIYADFVNAAKLPDEAATLTSIQAKIEAYYKKGP